MDQPIALDRTDLRLLALLQTQGRSSNAELAAQVNLSASACLRRTQRLEAAGIIAGYGARLDARALGLGLQAFVRVQLEQHGQPDIEHFAAGVRGWDEVVACWALTGDMDYCCRCRCATWSISRGFCWTACSTPPACRM